MSNGTQARRARLIAALFASLWLSGAALAVQPDEILKDAALETRARALSSELRCLVCQNQSIDDSDAPLARDLRLLVRERLSAGDSDKAVMDYIVQRYGDFVLLRPPVNSATLLLWLAPLLALLFGALSAWRLFRRPAETAADTGSPSLSADEQRRLDNLLHDQAGN